MTPFDYVEWAQPDGPAKRLSPSEFLAIPLTTRVKALLGQHLRFVEAGKELHASVALDRIARASAAASTDA